MARFARSHRSWMVEISQEMVDVTSDLPTPNASWTFTDAAGHEHHYARGYPTLDYIVDAEHWCDGTEGFALHDPHMAVDESHYECKLCREVIEPAMDPPGIPKQIPGTISATLTGIRDDGVRVRMPVADEQELALLRDGDDEAAHRILHDRSRPVYWMEQIALR